MEWDLDKYLDKPGSAAQQSPKDRGAGSAPARSGSPGGEARRPARNSRGGSRQNQKRRRTGSLPPWLLVAVCLLFYAFCFHVWTEDHFHVFRFLTLVFLSGAFALLSALLGTIGKRRKYQKIIALVVVIFWAVMYLMEFFILDSFHNFYTIEGILTGAGNAGQADFARNTFNLVLKNFWRLILFALPIVGWFLANRYLRLPRILTRGMRRYLAAAGAALLLLGL